jgi:hypothetical protein
VGRLLEITERAKAGGAKIVWDCALAQDLFAHCHGARQGRLDRCGGGFAAQVHRRPGGIRHPSGRSEPALSPALQPRLQSDRNGLSKFKALLRAAAARSMHDLWQAIANAINRFTPDECRNYLVAARYDAT